MFAIVSAIVAIVLTAIGVAIAWLTYATAPRFSRRRLEYDHDESVPVINQRAQGSLTVAYGGNHMVDPYVVQFKLSNTGRRDVPTSAFDKAMPLRFNFGVKVVAILHRSYRPDNMIPPDVAFSEHELSVGPSLIPRGALLEYVLLVEGSCHEVLCRNPLEEVDVTRRTQEKHTSGMSQKTVLTWAAVAFLLWWSIQEPTDVARLFHNIGSVLTAAAQGLSNFIASI